MHRAVDLQPRQGWLASQALFSTARNVHASSTHRPEQISAKSDLPFQSAGSYDYQQTDAGTQGTDQAEFPSIQTRM